jgi:hypothetical protein
MFHVQDGLYLQRNDNGSVTITKTDGKWTSAGGAILFQQTLDAGSWCSVVLSMTAFSERPGDWHAWMDHHAGTKDILAGQRGGY